MKPRIPLDTEADRKVRVRPAVVALDGDFCSCVSAAALVFAVYLRGLRIRCGGIAQRNRIYSTRRRAYGGTFD